MSPKTDEELLETLEKKLFTSVDKATLFKIQRKIQKDLSSNKIFMKWLRENFPESLRTNRSFSILQGVYAFTPIGIPSQALELVLKEGLKTSKNLQTIHPQIVEEFVQSGKTKREALTLADQLLEDADLFGWTQYNPSLRKIATTGRRILTILKDLEQAVVYSEQFEKNMAPINGGQYFLIVMNRHRQVLFDTFLKLIEADCGSIKRCVLDAKLAPYNYNLGLTGYPDPLSVLESLDQCVSKITQKIDKLFERLEAFLVLTNDVSLEEDYRLVISNDSLKKFKEIKDLYKITLVRYHKYRVKQLSMIEIK